ERQDRGVERAPDERPRAELAGDRVPVHGAPEAPAELPDRERAVRVQDERDPGHQGDQDRAEQARERTEADVISGHVLRADLKVCATEPLSWRASSSPCRSRSGESARSPSAPPTSGRGTAATS